MVNVEEQEDMAGGARSAKSVLAQIRDLELEVKQYAKDAANRKRDLEQQLGVARYREQQAARPPTPETPPMPEELLARRERSRSRAEAKARVGALRATLAKRREELVGCQRQRDRVTKGSFRLEERVSRDAAGNRVVRREKVLMRGTPGARTEWDSRIVELEETCGKLVQELTHAEAVLESFLANAG